MPHADYTTGKRALGEQAPLLILGDAIEAKAGKQDAQVTLDRGQAEHQLADDLLIGCWRR
jgi:hypothetical protein